MQRKSERESTKKTRVKRRRAAKKTQQIIDCIEKERKVKKRSGMTYSPAMALRESDGDDDND